MNTKSRLIQYLDFKGITKSMFFAVSGIKRGFLDADKLSGAVNDDCLAKILATYPDVNLIWLITGEGEMLIPPEGAKKDTIYINNPDKDEIIQLQREQIQLLKEKLANFKKVSTGYVPTPPTIPAAATPDVEAASVTRIIEHSEEPSRRRP